MLLEKKMPAQERYDNHKVQLLACQCNWFRLSVKIVTCDKSGVYDPQKVIDNPSFESCHHCW